MSKEENTLYKISRSSFTSLRFAWPASRASCSACSVQQLLYVTRPICGSLRRSKKYNGLRQPPSRKKKKVNSSVQRHRGSSGSRSGLRALCGARLRALQKSAQAPLLLRASQPLKRPLHSSPSLAAPPSLSAFGVLRQWALCHRTPVQPAQRSFVVPPWSASLVCLVIFISALRA